MSNLSQHRNKRTVEKQRTPKAPTFEVHGPADTSIVLQDNIIYAEMTSCISSCATGSWVVHE